MSSKKCCRKDQKLISSGVLWALIPGGDPMCGAQKHFNNEKIHKTSTDGTAMFTRSPEQWRLRRCWLTEKGRGPSALFGCNMLPVSPYLAGILCVSNSAAEVARDDAGSDMPELVYAA